MKRYFFPVLGGAGIVAVAAWATLSKTEEPESKSFVPAPLQRVPEDASSVERVRQLAQRGSAQSTQELIKLYGTFGDDPAQLPAKTLALSSLLSEPNVGLRLQNVFKAIDEDATPPEDDPLWSTAVESTADVWSDPAHFKPGRDLLLTEKRARPRRLLIESFASFIDHGGADKLNTLQRNGLTQDLIDSYFQKNPSGPEKEAIEGILRDLGQPDVASALTDDLGPGSQHPAIVEYLKQLEAAEREFGITPPPGAKP